MLNETTGAAFRSSAMLIANDRVHLVPYRDQHQRASNISPAVTSVKSSRAFAFFCVDSLTGSFVNRKSERWKISRAPSKEFATFS